MRTLNGERGEHLEQMMMHLVPLLRLRLSESSLCLASNQRGPSNSWHLQEKREGWLVADLLERLAASSVQGHTSVVVQRLQLCSTWILLAVLSSLQMDILTSLYTFLLFDLC